MRYRDEERIIREAEYIIQNNATVRQTADWFSVSKSTVYVDVVSQELKRINPQLAKKVKRVLNANKAERHIRGGQATKRKYSQKAK